MKMKAVLQAIRILVIILLIEKTCCQDGYSDQDILRLQQMAANNGQIETITSYSTNVIQRDPNSQSISSVSVQYHMTDDSDKLDENNRSDRSDRSRTKKVYRIKNPFQRQTEENDRSQDGKTNPLDNGTGASNQYAAMQYSLPPEEFLQQMRAENQFHQQQQSQQQQQQQLSTQSSSLGYTATPLPQFQYSTMSTSNYDLNNQQSNQVPQLESKSFSQLFHTNNFQYNAPNSFGLDIGHSTPSPLPQFLSTPIPNSQYLATPSNTYVSSSSPMYISSPPSLQQYVSSPLSSIQTSSADYGSGRVTTTIGSNALSYDSNDLNKNIQIDHYDNSANGMRYPTNQQFQNNYPSSTLSPTSAYSDYIRDSWQNGLNNGVNSKSAQEFSQSQLPNSRYSINQQDSRQDSSYDNINADTHRIGNYPSANNVYLNFVQPDYQLLNNLKNRAREYEQETPQSDIYSHGDYGWKLSDKKSANSQDGPTPANYPRYQTQQSDNNPVSQMNFHLDTSKSYNHDQTSKSSSERLDAQDFAKAAAKAHEQYKQQQQLESNNYPSSNQYNYNGNLASSSNLYSNNNDKQRNKMYSDGLGPNSYSHSNQQNDLITLSPYFYSNVRENSLDPKTKQPFDHDKALKNIVPIDVSNVVSNSENQVRASSTLDLNNKYSIANYAKDQNEQNVKQYYKPLTDSYYKDKNAIYGFNIKTKPEETVLPERLKQMETNIQLQGKPQTSELYYNYGIYNDNKRLNEDPTQSHYLSQLSRYQDSLQSSANVQQQGVTRPLFSGPSDFSNILKLNDIPFRLTQGLSADSLRLHNNNFDQSAIPTPLPVRLNQNVDNHQIDVATSILNKLMANKPSSLNARPEVESQTGNVLSTINGFKVANPYNMDLKLVADMLKGKLTLDESNISSLRDQFNKPSPLKLDVSQLQQLLLKNENANFGLVNNGFNSLSSPYFEVYNPSPGYYQGVKYSRSQEEEENIPIADASSTHPIGAVVEEDDSINGQEGISDDTTATGDDATSVSLNEDRPKTSYSSSFRSFVDRHRHPNSLVASRNSIQRKHPKSEIGEPYPLLKPPLRLSRNRAFHSNTDKYNRRRRLNKPKILRIFKTEPLFEAESSVENDEPSVTTLLRPPPPVAAEKSDVTDDTEGV